MKQINDHLADIEQLIDIEIRHRPDLHLQIQNIVAALRKVTATVGSQTRSRGESQHSEIELIKAGQRMVATDVLRDICSELGVDGDGDGR